MRGMKKGEHGIVSFYVPAMTMAFFCDIFIKYNDRRIGNWLNAVKARFGLFPGKGLLSLRVLRSFQDSFSHAKYHIGSYFVAFSLCNKSTKTHQVLYYRNNASN